VKKVLCHGVFDILHAGHLAYFEAAKKYGDHLIVSITSDRFVNKGPGRPYFTAQRRADMVRALNVVDDVRIIDAATAIPAIEEFRPDFYVKGPDYRDLTKDVTGEIYNEKKAVESYGGKLVFTDEDSYSSSTIINRFFQGWTDQQKTTIDQIRSLGGFNVIEKTIEAITRLKVLVIGEPILDVYRFVNPEGISSKSPSISARFQYEETYHGGSMAIKSHLDSFANDVWLQAPQGMMPKKIRYISGSQRIFEVTEIEDNFWEKHNPEYFCDKIIDLSQMADVVILADFGHGLFSDHVISELLNIPSSTFVGLNVQTNSSNYGFNIYDKHMRWNYLCLDTRELRLAEHDRFAAPLEIARKIHNLGERIGVTVGPNGAYLVGEGEYFSPAFADNIVDATGAGDAYFAITTVLLASGCNPALVPFIGNVFAGLKTQIIGNKRGVTKASLLKACQGILK